MEIALKIFGSPFRKLDDKEKKKKTRNTIEKFFTFSANAKINGSLTA